MDWSRGWRNLITAFVITVIGVEDGDGDCPPAYWEEPSRRCSSPLVSVLEQLQTAATDAAWTSNTNDNRTCALWRQTNSCYHQLMLQCRLDRIAAREIAMYVGRYRFMSVTCNVVGHTTQRQDRRRLVSCFLPHIKPTRICSEAFDSHFRNYVADKQYRNACRVVSTAMKCFDEIRNLIAQTCDSRAADEYQASFIQPLVEQTRDTVLTKLKCTLSAPYEHYFNYTRPSSEHSSLVVVSLVVALVFTRWRYSL